MTKLELIEYIQAKQAERPDCKVNATSTLKSKSIAQLEELANSFVTVDDVADAVESAQEAHEFDNWTRSQCVEYLRNNHYDGPVSYLMPQLREIAKQWGA